MRCATSEEACGRARRVGSGRSWWARGVLAILALSLVVGVAGCGNDSAASTSGQRGPATATLTDLDPTPVGPLPTPTLPVTVRSFDGTDVTITDADRIIAVDRYGTLAQIVWALGMGPKLVGRSTSAAFPAVREVPNVAGGNGMLSVESVLAQRPSVFLTDTVSVTPAIRDQLKAAGVTVVYFDPQRTMDGVVPQIEAVAGALGVPERGQALGQRTRDEIAAATAAVPKQDPALTMAFLYLRTTSITFLAGPGSGADALIAALGGKDAGAALKEPFVSITSEAMIAAAPDLLIVMSDGLKSVGGVDGLQKVPGIAQTPAGRNKRVVDMSDSVLFSFGPNTGKVIAALSKAIYGPVPA
ncbi:heme/hemin ABC transporter substrate-binding protein [Nocardia altamirensis]|uniref:heme/hemin ABC transporter substrate-binding protein n=1 Tax=Nocardia altamirensis TaxID=472158 RepID=UPI0009FC6F2E|nr:ABC transporter substrate-binding protein [Nocardia altamirensis]